MDFVTRVIIDRLTKNADKHGNGHYFLRGDMSSDRALLARLEKDGYIQITSEVKNKIAYSIKNKDDSNSD